MHTASFRFVVAILVGAAAACHPSREPATVAKELPTVWVPPPGDPLEHSAAGFAKILCSAIFITGRSLASAAAEDGFFVSPPADRRQVTDTVVDTRVQSVTVALANGVHRTARRFGDQGCVTLPGGKDSVEFRPERIASALTDSRTRRWPMGDVVAKEALPAEVNAAKLSAVVDAAFSPASALTAAFVVVYKGRIIAERYQRGLSDTTRLPGWSMGKSVTATTMARLLEQKVYDLWAPAPVEEWQQPNDVRRTIRIADIFRMSSGLRFVAPQDPDYNPARGYPDHLYVYTGAIDAHRWAITRPPQWPPNTVGRYRNSDPLTLAYLVKKAALARGEDPLSFPQKLLFDKIGVSRMTLETDPFGNFLGQGYELAPARDWAPVGMLYLQDGVWNGERLLPAGFVDFVRTPAPAWSTPVYGGMFWLNRTKVFPVPEDAFYMAGVGGQNTIIVPTHDLVVVRLGHYAGATEGGKALNRALALLMEAIPQVRTVWQPPNASEDRRSSLR
jgi:CubicO group peptidase (beta-lactamase class C family)